MVVEGLVMVLVLELGWEHKEMGMESLVVNLAMVRAMGRVHRDMVLVLEHQEMEMESLVVNPAMVLGLGCQETVVESLVMGLGCQWMEMEVVSQVMV